MKRVAVSLALLVSAAALASDEKIKLPVTTEYSDPKTGDFVFHLLPKSFQRNPLLDMTVIGEVTSYGATLPETSPQNPVFYVAHDAGMKTFGDTVGAEKTPDQAQLKKILTHALSRNGYLPADESTKTPSLALVYYWGAYNEMSAEDKDQFPQLARQQSLERAALIGPYSFQRRTADRYARTTSYPSWSSLSGNRDLEYLSWPNRFAVTPENQYLDDQAERSLYFVVVSAYDYQALAKGERKLAWRAKLTVNSQGVAMNETIPPLVVSAAPFFGRDTHGTQGIQRLLQRGKVEIGDLTVVQSDVPVSHK